MYTKVFYSQPDKCPFENCHHPFYKESHIGYRVLSTTEVLAILRCPKCRFDHEIPQPMSIAHRYRAKLKPDPELAKRKVTNRITAEEHQKITKELETVNPLKTLNLKKNTLDTPNYGEYEE